MKVILITFGFSAILAFTLGGLLALFQEIFKVVRDPKVGAVRAALPGVNCGGCGYPGCDGYAEAVAAGNAPVTKCAPGGKDAAERLAAIMGVNAASESVVAVLLCRGTKAVAPAKGEYVGIPTCRASKLSAGSVKLCAFGCQGFGDCVNVCKFDALSMGDDGLPHVDYSKCSGCGMCAQECPQLLFAMTPKARVGSVVLCSNRAVVKATVLKTCKVGCIKCDACVKNCPEQCIAMVNGIPVTDYAKCTNCGICVQKCPTKCYRLLDGVKTDVEVVETAAAV
ncbi:MAG: RnfABCDGE type electron transport complex subunit B [Spirochaetes bacterium]|nr:RnfABCDGE type electron transport complex subunit B [Spirochaetota bacterium]